jgi:hypothetical protein
VVVGGPSVVVVVVVDGAHGSVVVVVDTGIVVVVVVGHGFSGVSQKSPAHSKPANAVTPDMVPNTVLVRGPEGNVYFVKTKFYVPPEQHEFSPQLISSGA